MPGYPPFDPLTEQRQASDLEGLLTVHNILQSYHGNYDLFAEAIQNAVDAVHQQWRQTLLGYEPEILVEVNAQANTFTVIDNGVQPGVNPYWVKVVQQDMEMAWISPVFADYMP